MRRRGPVIGAAVAGVLGLVLLVAGFAGVGGKEKKESVVLTSLPSLDVVSRLPVAPPPAFVPATTVRTDSDFSKRNLDQALQSSLRTNGTKGSVSWDYKLQGLQSTLLKDLPKGRDALAFMTVDLLSTEAGAQRFATDLGNDLTGPGNNKQTTVRLGAVPGLPASSVFQGTAPLPDPTDPNHELVTTFVVVPIGPAVAHASFNCVDCPKNLLTGEEQAFVTSFLNPLAPKLPKPGSSVRTSRDANTALVLLGVLSLAAAVGLGVVSLRR